MKRIVLILSVIIILMTGCSNKLQTYKEINYDKFTEMINNKENFIFYIGSSSCSHCAAYTLTLNRIIKKYQVEVYYIDIQKLSSEEHKQFQKKINFNGTPTTVFITNGEEKSVYNRIEGEQPYDKIIDMFKRNNYIK